MDALVHNPDLKESIISLDRTLKDAGTLARNLDTRLKPLLADLNITSEDVRRALASLTVTSEAARSALVQAEKTLALNQGVPGELASSFKDTLESLRLTLEHTHDTIEGLNRITAQNANIGYDISVSLEQMTALARSVRSLPIISTATLKP